MDSAHHGSREPWMKWKWMAHQNRFTIRKENVCCSWRIICPVTDVGLVYSFRLELHSASKELKCFSKPVWRVTRKYQHTSECNMKEALSCQKADLVTQSLGNNQIRSLFDEMASWLQRKENEETDMLDIPIVAWQCFHRWSESRF